MSPKLPNKPLQAPTPRAAPAIIAEELSPWGNDVDMSFTETAHDYFHIEGYSDKRRERELAVRRGEHPDPLPYRFQYVSVVNPMGGHGRSGRKAGEFQAKGYVPVLFDEAQSKYGIDPSRSGFSKAPDGTCIVGDTQMLMVAPARVAAAHAKAQRELTKARSAGSGALLEQAVDRYNAEHGRGAGDPGATSIIQEESLHKA